MTPRVRRAVALLLVGALIGGATVLVVKQHRTERKRELQRERKEMRKAEKRARAARDAEPAEHEVPFPPHLDIPPAPALSAEETLATLAAAPGFRVELVASEPLIRAPVAMRFDAAGRIWVVEMNGFMPNADGAGEDAPNGRVVVLEDTDGDGRMDRSTVFLDGLVLPRAIALRKGGALIAEPPNVWWCPDEDGDLKADAKLPLIASYSVGSNPEHLPNGLLLALDNWFYSAKSNKRHRFLRDGTLRSEPTAFRGQWGISQDDFGRLYFNYNSDQLRGDLLPGEYLARNPHFKARDGLNVQLASNQRVFPSRVTPGVARGYREGELASGKLVEFTAACAPHIYRGDLFAHEFRGNSFVAEPAANLVKRNIHSERNGRVTAAPAYNSAEFLTSTSERFRPVHLCDGPDGALYVTDMARGIVAHATYMTPWLRRQIAERGLDQPLDQGRIWRIVPADAPHNAAPDLSKADANELVALLDHDNGWTRDTAQRLLVERADDVALPALESAASAAKTLLGRLHALWTLEGLERLRPELILPALQDSEPKLRVAAIRLAEPFLAADAGLERQVFALANDPAREVRIQLLLTLGEHRTLEAEEVMLALLDDLERNALARSAAISGMHGRELEILVRLLQRPAFNTSTAGREKIVRLLTRCILDEANPNRCSSLLGLLENVRGWQQMAILDSAIGRGRVIRLDQEPSALAQLAASESIALQELAEEALTLCSWPGHSSPAEPPPLPPLTDAGAEFVRAGRKQYALACASCHQPDGTGMEGLAPPLARSEWVTGPEHRLIALVLQGVSGPIMVAGRRHDMDMPALGGVMTDEQVAQTLSYIRREWGNRAPLITPQTVAKVRAAHQIRGAGWTADELLQIDDD